MTGLTTSPPAGPHAARPGLVGCSPSLIATGAPRGDGRSQRERPASHGALDAAASTLRKRHRKRRHASASAASTAAGASAPASTASTPAPATAAARAPASAVGRQKLTTRKRVAAGGDGRLRNLGIEVCVDPLRRGGVARFLNHSCRPKLIKQRVCWDSLRLDDAEGVYEPHGMHFVRVAFFAAADIPAMTELTWDYEMRDYSGERPHKKCNCGAATCRGRLY